MTESCVQDTLSNGIAKCNTGLCTDWWLLSRTSVPDVTANSQQRRNDSQVRIQLWHCYCTERWQQSQSTSACTGRHNQFATRSYCKHNLYVAHADNSGCCSASAIPLASILAMTVLMIATAARITLAFQH